MADGYRRLRINTQERAMSTDINRLQQFVHQDLSEMQRYLLNVRTSDDDPGSSVETVTVGTPLSAEIFNGLMVKPQGGNLSLFVDPGVLGALAPDGVADDSVYKYIRDVGVSVLGSLVMTANASGSTRIDVIECRINPVENVVTDSRDIFNPTSGLFVAATITKELSGRLEYRVRAGIPNSGYPAAAEGWLPLCVASVPTGTTTNDTITFWDVRPLVSDRSRLVNATGEPEYLTGDGRIERVDATNVLASGIYRARVVGRLVGGILRRGTPGADADSVNLTEAANWADGGTYSEPQTGTLYVYLLFPAGLPRWARYTTGPAGRLPRAPKGIPVLSNVIPLATGEPSAAITLPTSTGLVTTTSVGMCIFVTRPDGVSQYTYANITNKQQYIAADGVPITGTYAGSAIPFDFTNALWPRNAKAMIVNAKVAFTVGAGVTISLPAYLSLYYAAVVGFPRVVIQLPAISGAAGAAPVTITWQSGNIRIPRPWTHPGASIPATWLAVLEILAGLTISGTPSLNICGYEF
jgi:hypothetical protein